MADDEALPPASLILQALHANRKEIAGTNERLDQTNASLDSTRVELSEKIENLRVFTVQKLTDLNAKVDGLGDRVDQLGDRLETSSPGSWARTCAT